MGIGLTITDDIAGSDVIVIVLQVVLHHGSARLACRRVIVREMSVDELFTEMDTLRGQSLEHQVMDGPERILRERIGTQSVLVGHHDQFEVGLLGNHTQIAEDAFLELQLTESVHLLIRRFLNQCAVAIDKQDPSF